MALGIAVDANRYSDFCRGEELSVRVIRNADRIVLPFIALAELRAGFRCGARSKPNERLLTDFLQSPRVEVVYPNDATTHFYALVFAELRQAGTPIPTNDLWIVALVLQHDLVLFSRDRHFDRVPRIPRV